MSTIIKQNDHGYDIVQHAFRSRRPLSLEGASLRFVMGSQDYKKQFINAEAYILNASEKEATLEYRFTNEDTLYPGHYIGMFILTWKDGKQKTFPSSGGLPINIQRTLDLGEDTVYEERQALKVSLIDERFIEMEQGVEEWKQNVADNVLKEVYENVDFDEVSNAEVKAARGGKASLGENIDGIVSQLAQTAREFDYYANPSDMPLQSSQTRYIAHTGFYRVAPTNTEPAYEAAGKAGFWGGETDARFTADGHCVIAHGNDVADLNASATGLISEMTLNQVKAIEVTKGANVSRYPKLKVMTLDEYLKVCKRRKLVPVIELKWNWGSSQQYDSLISIIKKNGFEANCIVMCSNKAPLDNVRIRSSKIVLQYLSPVSEDALAYCSALKNSGINSEYRELTKEQIELAQSKGIHVNCYTVNDYTEIRKLVSWGINYITTDLVVGDVL